MNIKILSILLLLSSCTIYQYKSGGDKRYYQDIVDPYYTNKDLILKKIKCDYDKFEQVTWCYSPSFYNTKKYDDEEELFFNKNNLELKFRTIKTKTSIMKQLYFVYSSSDWSFFYSAFDENGNKLSFTEIDQNVLHNGRINEKFGINIDDRFISKYKDTGVEIKIKGKKQDLIFKIQPAVIEALSEHLKNIK